MAYRFTLRHEIEPEFRRIALEQIDRVIAQLTGADEIGATVHESRKGLKRLRALLRLVRPSLPEATFAAHNAALRDTGRLLSGTRDRQVLADVAASVAEAMAGRAAKSLHQLRGELAPAAAGEAPNGHSVAVQAVERLQAIRKQLARIRLDPAGFATIERGLERGYRRGRRLLRTAYAEPSDEVFHELRKAVQLQWRHMQLLSRAWPDLFTARVEAARRLSQILGDDHDLAVLTACVRAAPGTTVSIADGRAIARQCAARQHELRAEAQPLCAQLYAERPRRFAKRISALWSAAESAAALREAAARPAAPKHKRPKPRTGTQRTGQRRQRRAGQPAAERPV